MSENDQQAVDAGAPSSLSATAPPIMDLLAEHVPLALLADLAAKDGPVSQAILETEGLPTDAWWEDDEDPPTPSDQPPSASDVAPA